MLLNIKDVLSDRHETVRETVSFEGDEVTVAGVRCAVLSGEPLAISVEHVKDKELLVSVIGRIGLEIPCDRCLTPVEYEVDVSGVRHIDLHVEKTAGDDELDESFYVDGFYLDVDKLLYNEILIGWPTKVLCGEDCKGICSECGQNLNEGDCGCSKESLDPRMSVVRDLFEKFKEV